jgi:hypothetical protein
MVTASLIPGAAAGLTVTMDDEQRRNFQTIASVDPLTALAYAVLNHPGSLSAPFLRSARSMGWGRAMDDPALEVTLREFAENASRDGEDFPSMLVEAHRAAK